MPAPTSFADVLRAVGKAPTLEGLYLLKFNKLFYM